MVRFGALTSGKTCLKVATGFLSRMFPPMIKLLRFRDLKERGIVSSWAQLRNLTERSEFPRGRMISSNCRCWTEVEIGAWFETRPIVGPEPRGAARARRGRPR